MASSNDTIVELIKQHAAEDIRRFDRIEDILLGNGRPGLIDRVSHAETEEIVKSAKTAAEIASRADLRAIISITISAFSVLVFLVSILLSYV